jgi:hypothetical protein
MIELRGKHQMKTKFLIAFSERKKKVKNQKDSCGQQRQQQKSNKKRPQKQKQ